VAGLHAAQLLDACLGLKTSLDTALAAAGLAKLAELVEAHEDPKTGRNAWPRCVVSLAGEHGREQDGMGGAASSTVERLTAAFEVQLDGSERDALAYEGVVAEALRGYKATVAAAVTDGLIDGWWLAPGSLQRDTERRNAKVAWTVTIPVTVQMQW
jgi:hypothetical protein